MHISQIRKSAFMSVDIGAKTEQHPPAAIAGRLGISDIEIVALADQIDQLGTAFAEVQRQLSSLTARIRAMAPVDVRSDEAVAPPGQSPLPVVVTMRNDVMSALAAQEARPFDAEPLAAPVHAEETVQVEEAIATIDTPATPSVAEAFTDPAKVDHLQDILQSYRDLIAQPVKNEINRWITQAGGLSCEVADDGRFNLPGGDAKGLLALIPLDGQSAIILPAGRLVVDFTSNFANVIAMRAVTRSAFELTAGGGGKMQLIDPAYARWDGREWRLDRPGRIGGLSSD